MAEQEDERIVKSKISLKNALLKLMNLKSIQDISIMELVDKANVTRATFYKHYQYKEELLDEIIRDVIMDFDERCLKRLQNIQHGYLKQGSSSNVIIFDHILSYAELYKLMVSSKNSFRFLEFLARPIKDALMENLDFNDLDESINKEFLLASASYGTLGIIIEWIKQDFKYSPLYMSEQLVKIIQNTICNSPVKK